MYALRFILITALSLSLNAEEISFTYKEEVKKIDSQNIQYPKLWKKIQRIDPNSGKKFSYEGYFLNPLINHLYPKNVIEQVKTRAKDGYSLNIPRKILQNPKNFLAFKVLDKDNIEKERIYNKYFKTKIKWGPAYLLLEGKIASPYAIRKMTLLSSIEENPIVKASAQKYQKGAQVFVKRCAKCHRHQRFGGRKAPAIKIVLARWKRKKGLVEFLKAPQETIGRKIQMSPFLGTSEELQDLILFLKTI